MQEVNRCFVVVVGVGCARFSGINTLLYKDASVLILPNFYPLVYICQVLLYSFKVVNNDILTRLFQHRIDTTTDS